MSDRDLLLRQLYRRPRDEQVDARKRRFNDINAFISERGGWLVSVPGDPAMRLQARPGSPLPAELRELGYIVTRTGETERVTGAGITIVETFDLLAP